MVCRLKNIIKNKSTILIYNKKNTLHLHSINLNNYRKCSFKINILNNAEIASRQVSIKRLDGSEQLICNSSFK